MLSAAEITAVTLKAALDYFGGGLVADVLIEEVIPHDDGETIKLLIVLKDTGDINALTGRMMNEFSLDLIQHLRLRGDQRFPVVTYALQSELTERLSR